MVDRGRGHDSQLPAVPSPLGASIMPYDITATYSGDASFSSSAGTATAALTITPAISLTSVTSPTADVIFGNESTGTLTATVGTFSPVVTPTGTVTFTTSPSGATLCTAPVVQPGGLGTTASASCTPSDTQLPVGSYDIAADYSGDTDVAGSSGTQSPGVIVSAASTTTALVSVTPATVAVGTSGPTVDVSVAPQFAGSPTGAVLVTAVNTTTSATTVLCTVRLTATTSGAPSTGSCSTGSVVLTPATYDIELAYTPDTPDFTGSSTTAAAALTVTTDTTTTAITSIAPSSATSGSEQNVVISTTVTPVHGGPTAPAPTGTVTLTTVVGTGGGATTVTVCAASLTQPGGIGTPVIARCSPTATALPVGTHHLIATYAGDTNYVGSVSSAATLAINLGIVAVTVTSSAGSVLPGRPVTLTATVIPPSGLAVPTGTVRFTDATSGAVLCAAAPLVTTGGVPRATCTAILPTTPTQQIVATYSGDTNYPTASGTTVQHIKHGYWTVAKDGGVFAFGDAQFYGSMGGKPLNQPIVGIAGTADAGGYWLVASDGGIFAFGDAAFYGSKGNQQLNQPMVGMQPTRDGKGYWMVAADGGVFNYGDAQFYGSTGNLHLNSSIVGMVATNDGLGYFLVAADGGVYAFGDARFVGNGTPNSSSPVVGLAPTPSGAGYWLASANGAVSNFGDAKFYGSMANQNLVSPVVGIGSTTDGGGYWLVAADGGIFAFGNAIFDGSTGNITLNSPMVSLADI